MSNISPDFIYSVGSLYEEINVHNKDFLNENSEYYDAEMSYLVEDIFSTISTSMIYGGYSASAVIGFLADSSSQSILEKYLTFDENILSERVIDEDYILEQFGIFDYCIDEGLGTLLGKVTKGAVGLAGRIASKPARMRVSRIMSNTSNPERARELLQTTAQRAARNSNVGGYSATQSPVGAGNLSAKQSAELLTKAKIGQVTQKVKDIAANAKSALTSPTAKTIGKGLALFGLPAAGGYLGAKLATSQNKAGAPSIRPGTSSTRSVDPPTDINPPPPPPASPSGTPTPTPSQFPRNAEVYNLPRNGKLSVPASANQRPQNSSETSKKPDLDPMAIWRAANPRLAAASDLRSLRDPSASREQINRILYDTGTKASTGSGDSQIERDTEELRRQVKNKKSENEPLNTTDESYEPYDVILGYLIERGHADSIEDANYIMLEMDESAIGLIMEEYENYLFAEEVSDWVDSLLYEGYDLSEYTWDDIVEYYVNEGFKDTGYHDNPYIDSYSSGNRIQSRATSSRGKRIQNRVNQLKTSGDNERANHIHKIASDRKNQERGLAKQKRNNRRGPGPRRAKEDAMRDMRNSGF